MDRTIDWKNVAKAQSLVDNSMNPTSVLITQSFSCVIVTVQAIRQTEARVNL
jgi:hypothetical protein